jgi:hypothetical protein
MAGYATRIEARARQQLSPGQIFDVARSREKKLSRLLIVYIVTGLAFMLLPGTFLGVWNLISISSQHAAASISDSWIQAHGHAQVFGWIGTFILGIGFYSIPKLRRLDPFAMWTAWTCWALWTSGVTLRWFANVYLWHWRTLLPLSATFELVAFLLFFRAVSGHKPEAKSSDGIHVVQPKSGLEKWILVVICGAVSLLATLIANVGAAFYLAFRGISPAFPHEFDQRFLVLMAWGFMATFVWGFSARWLPVFLGLKNPKANLLVITAGLNSSGVVVALAGEFRIAVLLILAASVLSIYALRLFEQPEQPAKTKGVHASFPVFIRFAYVWLVVAAALGAWAAMTADVAGIWGASRHALTVGFVSTMVFCIGQRVLPAFSGMRALFSPALMFTGLVLLTTGCILRVTNEVLAYQHFATWAWSWLPVSAVVELAGVTVFAVNMIATFISSPAVGTQEQSA